jgi:hypothetical protein
MALAQGLGDRPPYISWHRFDAVIAPHTVSRAFQCWITLGAVTPY